MKTKQFVLGIAMLIILSAIIVGCQKDLSSAITDTSSTSSTTQNVSMYLTDGPGMYDKVNLDIQSVLVLVDTSANTRRHDSCNWGRIGGFGPRPDSSLVWENLNITPAIYNILALSNGVDTLLAQSNIPKGTVRLIRINLGTNNTVVKDSVTYPLTIPAGTNSYILVQMQGGEWDNFATNHFRLWLDFDVARSIVQINSTTFYLRPVVNFFVTKNTGSISGTVAPLNAKAIVTVYGSSDTAYAIPGPLGNYVVRGLADGTYSAYFHSYNGYKDTTITNIKISNASNVKEGVTTLHK